MAGHPVRRGLFMVLSAFLALFVAAGMARASLQLVQQSQAYVASLTPVVTPDLALRQGSADAQAPLNSAFSVPLPALSVQRQQLVNADTGKPVVLIGAAHSSLEYSCQGDGHYTYADMLAMKRWSMNVIRIPLSSQLWLNQQGRCPTYIRTVSDIVTVAEQAQMYVMLSLNRDDPLGDDPTVGGSQYPLPGADADVRFWTDVAQLFRARTNVIFDLFSEPHGVTFDQWFLGSSITISGANDLRGTGVPQLAHGTYGAIGMRDLVAKIRRIALNVIVISGTNWGYDLSDITDARYLFSDVNLLFGTHLWDRGDEQPQQWDHDIGATQKVQPTIVSELGQYDCGASYVRQAVAYATARAMSWLAWTWSVGPCKGSSDLLSGWDGTPNSPYSQYLRTQMRAVTNFG